MVKLFLESWMRRNPDSRIVSIIWFIQQRTSYLMGSSKIQDIVRRAILDNPSLVCVRSARKHLLQNRLSLQYSLLKEHRRTVEKLTVVIAIDRVLLEERETILERAAREMERIHFEKVAKPNATELNRVKWIALLDKAKGGP